MRVRGHGLQFGRCFDRQASCGDRRTAVSEQAERPLPSLRLDLVGCGEAMERVHAPSVASVDSWTVRGCFDLNRDSAERVAEMTSASLAGSAGRVEVDDPVDAVIIATPPEAHAELARRYLSARKHVLLEKPLTTTAAELEELIDLSDRVDRRLIAGHFRRLFPSVTAARRFVALGALGRIVAVEATEGVRWDWAPKSDYVVESPFGGVAYDTGSHLIDMALFILGLDEEPEATYRLTSVEKAPAQEPAQQCEFSLAVECARHGTFATYVALARTAPLAKGVKVWGENGVLFVSADFATTAVLRTSEGLLEISEGGHGVVPATVWYSVVEMHREFAASVDDPGRQTVLDARRFLPLMRILEDVWQASPQ
jgi:predicted dehydrogenase